MAYIKRDRKVNRIQVEGTEITMSKFAGISEASSYAGGNYFKAGLYTVSIKEVKMVTSRKRDDLFIVECEILTSSCEELVAGMTCSWVVNMKHDASLGNIKQFTAIATGSPEKEIDEEVCELVVSNENPLKGVKIGLECNEIKTRSGGDFTKHTWFGVK